jgi:divalent metal cation (Fe/Co/Zn/Cd) transporter
VVFENAAALVGIALAALGTALTQITGVLAFDAIASIAIGVVLAAVALLFGYECHGLLIGERASMPVIRDVRAMAAADPSVEKIDALLTMQMGPGEVLLVMQVRLHQPRELGTGVEALDQLEHQIRAAHPEVRNVFFDITGLGEAKR